MQVHILTELSFSTGITWTLKNGRHSSLSWSQGLEWSYDSQTRVNWFWTYDDTNPMTDINDLNQTHWLRCGNEMIVDPTLVRHMWETDTYRVTTQFRNVLERVYISPRCRLIDKIWCVDVPKTPISCADVFNYRPTVYVRGPGEKWGMRQW